MSARRKDAVDRERVADGAQVILVYRRCFLLGAARRALVLLALLCDLGERLDRHRELARVLRHLFSIILANCVAGSIKASDHEYLVTSLTRWSLTLAVSIEERTGRPVECKQPLKIRELEAWIDCHERSLENQVGRFALRLVRFVALGLVEVHQDASDWSQQEDWLDHRQSYRSNTRTAWLDGARCE